MLDPVANGQALKAATEAASAAAVVIDREAGKTGVVVGAATATLDAAAGKTQLGALQLSIARTADSTAQPVTIQAEVLPAEGAQRFSPVGMAFKLGISQPDGVQASAIGQGLQLTLDYRQIPMRYGGSFQDRLALYRVHPCPPRQQTDEEIQAGEISNEPCQTWELLPSFNDTTNQQLIIDLQATAAGSPTTTEEALPTVTPSTVDPQQASQLYLPLTTNGEDANGSAAEDAMPAVTPPTVDPQQASQLYLPLATNGGAATGITSPGITDELYVLAASASSQQGNYAATPLANLSDYQVSLASGSAQTGYPVPLPPAAGGLAPAVALTYDSGSVDGMTSNKNNQPGWTGIGWNLESGYIVRHLEPCNVPAVSGNLCMVGGTTANGVSDPSSDAYSIVLNGVASRLVHIAGTNNSFRLQNDPAWQVRRTTVGAAGSPDTARTHWFVTTPDGTEYRFGGEFAATGEGGADLNSVFYVPIYNTNGGVCGRSPNDLCNVAWRWNLDRVEDTNDNVISYFYELETNFYQARDINGGSHLWEYVRAGNLSRIEYGRRRGNSTTIPTRVNFVTEERCEGACVWPANYPDTPGDLACGSSACGQTAPTFWSKKRLDYIEPQVYNQSTSAWVSVARYDLDYTFPTPPNDAQGDTSETKLWLNTITQKLGDGTGGLPAITYGHTMLANRWDHHVATVSPLNMPRINQITTQLGGVVSFTYGQSHSCQVTATDYIRYPRDCAPAWYVNGSDQGWGLFNKWKVMQQTTSDSFAGNDPQTLVYSYSAPTWHYSDDPALPDLNSCALCPARHWNDYRGSELVIVTDGSGAKSEYRLHRGMNGDRDTVAGGWFTATITLSDASTRPDENWLRGQTVETRRLTSTNNAKSRSVNWFTATLNAGSGINGAYFVGLQKNENTLYGTANKTTRTEYTYDSYGNVTREILHGDTAVTTDDRNVERSFLYYEDFWIVNRAQWEKLWSGTGSGGANQELAYTQYAYDGKAYGALPSNRGNLTKVKRYAQRTPTDISAETVTTYDAFGRPTVVTDARGNRTLTAYHPFYGYVTSVTNDRPPVNIINSLDHVTSFINDPAWGVQTQIIDPNGKVTDLQYDGYGRLQKVWLPTESQATDPATLEFVYDAAARPANVKSRQLRVKSSGTYLDNWAYVDGFGRDLQTQTPMADGSRAVVTKWYNNRGQLANVSAPFQQSGAAGSNFVAISDWATVANYRSLQYDELGNLWLDRVQTVLGITLWSTTTIHDAWQTRTFDPRGNRTDYDQNAFGQLAKVTEYNVGGQVYNTSYGYDLQGNLTSVTDAANNVTTITYDLLGRKLTMIDPDMGSWQYQYDAVGNLTGQRDGRNQWLYLEYDDLNRLIRKRRDTASTGPKVAEYLYDAAGQKGLLNKSLAYDSAGTTVQVEVDPVTYDNRNRVTQQNWVVAGGGTFRIDYAYNEADQRTSMTYPGGNTGAPGETVSYTYNAVGQLTGVSGSGVSYIASATYNDRGQPTLMVNDVSPNGLTRRWTYDTYSLRLSTLQAGKNAAFDDRQKLTYDYDFNGNVTSLIDGQNQDQKQCFQYDYLNRLTAAFTGNSGCTAYSATGTGPYSHSYGYDAIGNLTSYDGNSYTYGAKPHAVTSAFGNTYSYDANGNQTSRNIGGTVSTFTYDYENRLTAISGGATASFVYDADGNRVRSTADGVTTVYIAGVFEFIENGNTDKMTTYYDGNAMRRSGYGIDDGVFYLLQDHLKSSSSFVNQSGAPLANNYYYPYGGNRGGAFSNLTAKRFTSQYHENSLPGGEGLSYYNARWYDPQVGRFLSADTIVPGSNNPQAFNRYSYVFNNPLKYIDPSGHTPCLSSGMGVAFCGGGRSRPTSLPTVTSAASKTLWTFIRAFDKAYRSSRGFDIFYDGYELEAGATDPFDIGPKGGYGWYRYWDFQNNRSYEVRARWGGMSVGEGLVKGTKNMPQKLADIPKLFSGSATYVRGAGIYHSNTALPEDAVPGQSYALVAEASMQLKFRGITLPLTGNWSGATNYFNTADPDETLVTVQSALGVGTPGKSASGIAITSEIVYGTTTEYSGNFQMAVSLAFDRFVNGDPYSIPWLFAQAVQN